MSEMNLITISLLVLRLVSCGKTARSRDKPTTKTDDVERPVLLLPSSNNSNFSF